MIMKESAVPWITQEHRGDVHVIKVIQSARILQFVLSMSGQPLKERLLLVVALLYQAFGEVLYSVLQELIWGVQVENKIWGTNKTSMKIPQRSLLWWSKLFTPVQAVYQEKKTANLE